MKWAQVAHPFVPFRLEESHWWPNRAILCILVSFCVLYWSRQKAQRGD